MKRIVVVGGGITGLAAAYRLSRLTRGNYEIVLLEASDRLGGKILTEHMDGCVFELGPDSFLTAKPQALELIYELGLESKLLGTDPDHSDVFVYVRGRLRRIPDGLMLMAPSKLFPFFCSDLFTWQGKLRLTFDWFLPANAMPGGHSTRPHTGSILGPGGIEDESMGNFARRRFGKEALETLVQPVMAGIYAGDADQLSLKSTFPQFLELEQRYGSVIRGLRRSAVPKASEKGKITMFMTLSGGLGELTKSLAKSLGSVIRLSAPVRSILPGSSGYRLNLRSGEELPCDAVIMATQSWQSAEMVSEMNHPLAKALQDIPFASSATLSLAYDSASLPELPSGFGFVVAHGEAQWVSAVTFSSAKFPGRTTSKTFLIRCFLGGAGKESMMEQSDANIVDGVLSDLRHILKIQIPPKAARLHRWMRANPQYTVGHEAKLQRIQACLESNPGLWLAGASYRGVGIPDCVASGFLAAEQAHAFLSGC